MVIDCIDRPRPPISAEIPTTCSDISYQSAAHAFNREIFSRCVQIVEAADKQGHIEMFVSMVFYADIIKVIKVILELFKATPLKKLEIESLCASEYKAATLEMNCCRTRYLFSE